MGQIVELLKKTNSSRLKRIWNAYLRRKYKRLFEKDPALAADALFYRIFRKHMNLDNPRHLIEKITWMELHIDTSLWTQCADKYRMRDYVAKKQMSQYLPKLYGKWDNPDDIDFDKLPERFVLKANNGCGTVKLVKDKKCIEKKSLIKELKNWLKEPYGYMGAQIHYMSIKPCIIAEEMIIQDDMLNNLSPLSLVDFKVWCLAGKAEFTLITYDRTDHSLSLDLYDRNWNRCRDQIIVGSHCIVEEDKFFPKPMCLEEMYTIAESLAEPFPEVRIDFYISNRHPIIGEITLSTGYGYFTEELYEYMGSKIDLSKLERIK